MLFDQHLLTIVGLNMEIRASHLDQRSYRAIQLDNEMSVLLIHDAATETVPIS